jgi:nucleotide-binding universal stress UspA family protein
LIVIGSHGHGALYHLFAGDVASGILKDAKCPVLVVPSRVV